MLGISYDGLRYHGFSDENADVRTVASTLKRQLSKIHSGLEIDLQGASRTDRGVHALGQVVNYRATAAPFRGDYDRMLFALNRMLPEDLRVWSVREAELSFHASVSATGKRYRYTVDTRALRDPLLRHYAWHVPPPAAKRSTDAQWLDLCAMRRAAAAFAGEHDFRAFGNAPRGSARKAARESPAASVCTLWSVTFDEVCPGVVQIIIEGDRFLYKMVRRIVGALVRVGQGRGTVDDVLHALESGSLATEAMTFCAPAEGLVLEEVFYEPRAEGESSRPRQ